MRCRLLVVAFFAACVSACGLTKSPLNPPRLVTASDSDVAVHLFMQATLALAKYYGMEASYHPFTRIDQDDDITWFDVRATPKLSLFYNIKDYPPPEFRDRVDKEFGYNNLVRYYIQTGWKASQIICRNYLLGLSERNRYLEFLQQQFGVFDTLAAGLLALISPNKTLSQSWGLGIAAVNSGVDRYQLHRLSVERETAMALIEAAQNAYAKAFIDQIDNDSLKVRSPAGVQWNHYTFADALNAVNLIEYQCTREGVQSLLARVATETAITLKVDPETKVLLVGKNAASNGALKGNSGGASAGTAGGAGQTNSNSAANGTKPNPASDERKEAQKKE